MNVEVFRVRGKGVFVDVPIVFRGRPIHCAFFVDNSSMRLVRIFGDKVSQGRKVPVDVMRDARMQARKAFDELETQTDRITSFAFTADISTALAAESGV